MEYKSKGYDTNLPLESMSGEISRFQKIKRKKGRRVPLNVVYDSLVKAGADALTRQKLSNLETTS